MRHKASVTAFVAHPLVLVRYYLTYDIGVVSVEFDISRTAVGTKPLVLSQIRKPPVFGLGQNLSFCVMDLEGL